MTFGFSASFWVAPGSQSSHYLLLERQFALRWALLILANLSGLIVNVVQPRQATLSASGTTLQNLLRSLGDTLYSAIHALLARVKSSAPGGMSGRPEWREYHCRDHVLNRSCSIVDSGL